MKFDRKSGASAGCKRWRERYKKLVCLSFPLSRPALVTIEYHPADFDYLGQFPDAERIVIREGESCYAATDGSDAVLIVDSGTLACLFDDEDLSSGAISVRRFSSVAKRDSYVGDLLAGCRREDDAY